MTKGFSVALATFNGAKYLPVLLDSIVRQTVLPDEIVVSDDASSDTTQAIVSEFAAAAPLSVRLFSNKQQLGPSQNFAKAISLCSGARIALADQDDAWRVNKLERLASELELPGVLAVFSDADVVDARLKRLGYSMWERVHFTQLEQRRLNTGDGFSILVKHPVVTGATFAFNASLRDIALPIPNGWPHDAWLALVAAALSQIIAVPEPLLSYRQHDTNAVGGLRKSLFQEARVALSLERAVWYRDELQRWKALEGRLGLHAPQALTEKINHLQARASLPDVRWRRLPQIVRELASGRYARYSRNWGSIAIDILVK